ncbi:MAG: class I SAM-dependent methyltransferase [Candidatus Electryonea clarkiae]|nr:class I SAM-dependent methyltransferase [Candidatus Electryonea clarkiae]MDP8285233.1 class I SAM-dependent methyltransferase [Candidatus Electryonea clarkiae]
MDKISRFLKAVNSKTLSKQALIEALEQLSKNLPLNSKDCDSELLSEIVNKLRPLFLESSCLNHAFSKPFGYAGDYYCMYLIHINRPSGNGLGGLFDRVFLESKTCQSVRERSNIFSNSLRDLEIANDRQLNVLIAGCGPCFELANYFKKSNNLKLPSFTCVDHDLSAIEFSKDQLISISSDNKLRYFCSNIFKFSNNGEKYDFIYSAGLFDYLRDSLFKKLLSRLLNQLNKGGMMVIGNLSNKIPMIDSFTMEYILDWKIQRRGREVLKKLVTNADDYDIDTVEDCLEVGNYLIIRKMNN